MSAMDQCNGEYAAPVLAVCGYSGSGKTTLLEAAIAQLVQRGLAVAVVKHDAHRFEVDRPGKDSDRLFRAGATVVLRSQTEQFERRATPLSLEATLAHLACSHDLVLVEGHKQTALPKFWLAGINEPAPPATVSGIVSMQPWRETQSGERLAKFLEYVDGWLPQAWRARPLYRGLLLGGQSSRMGRPKQNVPFGESTLGDIVLTALNARTTAQEQGECAPPVALLGAGARPTRTQGEDAPPQLPDAPGFSGPGSGIIAAHRWAPQAGWVIAACDHPWVRAEHIAWLAAQRQPGRWAIIPRQRDGYPCPMLALYEPQALELIERLAMADARQNPHPSVLLSDQHTAIVQPPEELADGWMNLNTPEELRREEARRSVQ